ncbi:DnaJ C-terminal domain-containing protein [Rhizobium sp. LCM 4573]|uniref:DnaJ C-terminal domain-containing protein n=1 Tax=Rhizobium sp. LCM 4573 TaxID=1848291 RepID=UPI0008D945A7|nr:DnaJ C-terminal domain-containing protein [Rhizobium sp. LCM 4573]OHV75929.1 molecular chaperone DnaJ [Rhizobium sp. LCM 4573]
MRDPYSVLGVKQNADADEIKAAWRAKAKSAHPDRNRDDPSATTRFAELGQAYEVLKDPERRQRYDRVAEMQQTIMQQREATLRAAERAKAARANAEKVMEELARADARRAQTQSQMHGQTQGQAAGSGTESAEEMIERIFGSAYTGKTEDQGKPQPQGQATSGQAADEPFESANFPAPETGMRTDAEQKTPAVLQAVDLIASLVRRIRGTAPALEKAPDLTAEATVTIDDLLKQNWAVVQLTDEREVRFPLEAGMTAGHMLRLKSQGLKLPNMQRGDLVVTLKIAPDKDFRVEGFDIHTILPISLEDAVLGAEAELATPEGTQTIAVPAWSGSDRSVRLEGLGLPNDSNGRGDLVVELRVLLWDQPNDKVTDLMRHMREGLYI